MARPISITPVARTGIMEDPVLRSTRVPAESWHGCPIQAMPTCPFHEELKCVVTVHRDPAPLLKVELGKVFSSARHGVTRRLWPVIPSPWVGPAGSAHDHRAERHHRTDDGERDRPARREPVADRHCSAIVGPSGSRPNSSSTLIACASSVRAAASSARRRSRTPGRSSLARHRGCAP